MKNFILNLFIWIISPLAFWAVVFGLILFLASPAHAGGYDQQLPFPRCTSDKVEISRLVHKMTITIFKTWDKAGLYSGTDWDSERLWSRAKEQAKRIVKDNYQCKAV